MAEIQPPFLRGGEKLHQMGMEVHKSYKKKFSLSANSHKQTIVKTEQIIKNDNQNAEDLKAQAKK